MHRETRQIFAFHVSRSFNVLFPSCGPTERNGIILGDRPAPGELRMSNQSVKNQKVTGFRLPVNLFCADDDQIPPESTPLVNRKDSERKGDSL